MKRSTTRFRPLARPLAGLALVLSFGAAQAVISLWVVNIFTFGQGS